MLLQHRDDGDEMHVTREGRGWVQRDHDPSSSAHRGIDFCFPSLVARLPSRVPVKCREPALFRLTRAGESGRKSEPEVLRDYPFGVSRKALPRTTPAPNSLCFPRPRHSPPPSVACALSLINHRF